MTLDDKEKTLKTHSNLLIIHFQHQYYQNWIAMDVSQSRKIIKKTMTRI